jgi:hypothetical protein
MSLHRVSDEGVGEWISGHDCRSFPADSGTPADFQICNSNLWPFLDLWDNLNFQVEARVGWSLGLWWWMEWFGPADSGTPADFQICNSNLWPFLNLWDNLNFQVAARVGWSLGLWWWMEWFRPADSGTPADFHN